MVSATYRVLPIPITSQDIGNKLTTPPPPSNGGETVFYPHDRRSAKEAVSVTPETGMLLLHKHGDDCMLVSCSITFILSP